MLTNKIKDSLKEKTKKNMMAAMSGIKLDRRLMTKKPSDKNVES